MATLPNHISVSLLQIQSYSAAEWEDKRAFITQLYCTDKKSLKDLRVELAKQGFRPSVAMLRKRFAKWDIGRNHKESDMLYAVQLGLDALKLEPGKAITLIVRNAIISFDDVKHYYYRKGVRDVQALDHHSAIATSGVYIQPCLLTSDLEYGNCNGSTSRVFDTYDNIIVLLLPNQIPLTPYQPMFMQSLEKLLCSSQDHFQRTLPESDIQYYYDHSNWDNNPEVYPVARFFGMVFDGDEYLAKAKH